MLGEMFPGRKLRSEAGEAGSGQEWRLGAIDFDTGVVELHRPEPEPDGGGPDGPDSGPAPAEPTNGTSVR